MADHRGNDSEADAAAGVSGTTAEEPEHVAVYQRFRRLFGNHQSLSRDGRRRAAKVTATSVPYGEGREPKVLGEVVDNLTLKLGWNSPLAQGELLASWSDLVGEETAARSTPVSITDGVLTVSCDSTAWATQLRLMRSNLLSAIVQKYPDAGIQSIRFDGPGVPSWKKGPRSVQGRGPRDTYG
ncbi:MAG TPA: DciA family protein [Terrimesophilobacter sp.]|nr:DciA family protein [Terrimesophilobacter sp.]